MPRMIFADGHLHSNPVKGMGMTVIGKKFLEVGGWFTALVSLPPSYLGLDNTFDGYVKAFEVLVSECRVAKEIGLKVVCFAGVHPASIEDEISKQPRHSIKVMEKALSVIDYIAKLIRSGAIDGFGEIGRPHYKSIPEAFIVSNLVMMHAINLAKDLNAPVHLHLEQGGEVTAIDVDRIVKAVGIDRNKVILHHLDVVTAKASQNRNLIFTVPGKYPILRECIKILKPMYMVESDFIDDPRRAGVSSYPWDVVENQKRLLEEEVASEDYLYRINVDTVVELYKVQPP